VLPASSRNKKGKDGKWDFARLLVRNRGLLSGKAVENVLLDTLEGGREEGWSFDDLQREHERKAQAEKALQLLSDPDDTATASAVNVVEPTLPATITKAVSRLLTPLTALLLLATHLASTTPSKHDILLFSRLSNTSAKHRKIRYIKRGNPGSTPKKANEDGRRKDKTKRAGPRAVGLERVLALARAVSGEVLTEKGHKGWSDAAMGAMGELERMRLVRRDDAPATMGGGGEGAGESGMVSAGVVGVPGGGRWKVNVGRETVQELIGGFGLGIAEWELDI
jgi:hypothetical protein